MLIPKFALRNSDSVALGTVQGSEFLKSTAEDGNVCGPRRNAVPYKISARISNPLFKAIQQLIIYYHLD